MPAGMLANAGFNVIVFDLRDHGESSIDDDRVSGGQDEWVDVIAIFDWLVEEQNADSRQDWSLWKFNGSWDCRNRFHIR